MSTSVARIDKAAVKTSSDVRTRSLAAALACLDYEASAISQARARLQEESFCRATELILRGTGKVIITGMGKSGLVGQKIAATLCSTGSSAVFLHPSEAVHGDLGLYSAGDVTILLSKSGTTAELVRLVPLLRNMGSPIIGILGNLNSPLARIVDVVLDGSVAREADPLNVAPTASAVAALALGDALASALSAARQFTLEDYARLHPAGQLGRNLCLKVRDVMHPLKSVACIQRDQPIREIVIEMTRYPRGAACVLGENDALVGLITDGDIRRALHKYEDLRAVKASDIMNSDPISVHPQASLKEALRLMEDRPSQISVLPVLQGRQCVGLVRIHDIYSGTS